MKVSGRNAILKYVYRIGSLWVQNFIFVTIICQQTIENFIWIQNITEITNRLVSCRKFKTNYQKFLPSCDAIRIEINQFRLHGHKSKRRQVIQSYQKRWTVWRAWRQLQSICDKIEKVILLNFVEQS